MAITGEHAAAERALRELLRDAGLPQPDEVEYREESVVFLWHETKLAVIVDLDGAAAEDGAGVDGTAAQYETGAGDGTDPFENDNGRPP